MHDRIIHGLDGALNFRDFGGYAAGSAYVARGALFRSGDPHCLTAKAVLMLQHRLGIRTIVDLRSHHERAERCVILDGTAIRSIHEPIRTRQANPAAVKDQAIVAMARGSYDWPRLYALMLDLNIAAFGRILRLLAEEATAPVLIHCAGGRDRTGLTAALILLTLGVSDDDIAADYALTGDVLAHGWRTNTLPAFFNGLNLTIEERIRTTETRPDWMHATLATIRTRFGGVEGLLHLAGVTPEHVATLRRLYLADAVRDMGAGDGEHC